MKLEGTESRLCACYTCLQYLHVGTQVSALTEYQRRSCLDLVREEILGNMGHCVNTVDIRKKLVCLTRFFATCLGIINMTTKKASTTTRTDKLTFCSAQSFLQQIQKVGFEEWCSIYTSAESSKAQQGGRRWYSPTLSCCCNRSHAENHSAREPRQRSHHKGTVRSEMPPIASKFQVTSRKLSPTKPLSRGSSIRSMRQDASIKKAWPSDLASCMGDVP